MNKKSLITFNVINFIPKIIFLTVVVLAVVFVTNSFASYEIETSSAEAYTLINRVIYSPNAISFSDGVRNFPGVIDLSRFTEENLNKVIYNPENRDIAAELTLTGFNKAIIFNKDNYNRLHSQRGLSGGSKEVDSTVYVLVKDGNKLIPANLKIVVYVR